MKFAKIYPEKTFQRNMLVLKNVIFVVCDGLGDRPISELGNLTPLEAAKTPNLDSLASESECGMIHTMGRGIVPGSDIAHLSLFGYPPAEFYSGRGPIEAAGIGLMPQAGDVAMRCNLGTVAENLAIIDRRAGRIRDVSEFVKAIDGQEIEGVKFIVRPGTAYRAALVMRGPGLSSNFSDPDPHAADAAIEPARPLDNSPEAAFTARILNTFLQNCHQILNDLPTNKERVAQGLLPANYLLTRGAGQTKHMPSFQERWGFNACCIAGGGLYKGIGRFLGMEVLDIPGANAQIDTNIKRKFETALEMRAKYDFIFVHVKATDSLGEDGNFQGKREFIERIDEAAAVFRNLSQETLFILTGDHSTPCALKSHSADPVPVMLRGFGTRPDSVTTFGERSCTHGGLGFITGTDVMPQIHNLFGRLQLSGG